MDNPGIRKMAHSKDANRYPKTYSDLALEALAALDPENEKYFTKDFEVELEFPDKRGAANFRHKYHAFARAVRLKCEPQWYEDKHGIRHWFKDPDAEKWKDIRKGCDAMSLIVEEGPMMSHLRFVLKKDDPKVAMLDIALAKLLGDDL